MKIVIAVDDSAHSSEAIDYALRASWPQGSQFHVISAVAPIFLGPGEAVGVDAVSRLMAEQEKYHDEVARREGARLAKGGMKVEAHMVIGDPRAAIIDTAVKHGADLIVLGSHGRTGIKRLLLGSVASYVVAHAPCSVLVVRKGAIGP